MNPLPLRDQLDFRGMFLSTHCFNISRIYERNNNSFFVCQDMHKPRSLLLMFGPNICYTLIKLNGDGVRLYAS
ncbi:hypothetical protein LPA04_24280 [Lacticaseibacillus paracasei subsp. paracasei]|nr:hypothetical protein LPA04_24280 [Lacticaseibacillus paracasei subsp. paracasei]